MGEAQREKMETEVLGEIGRVDCQTEFGQNPDDTTRQVDGWILPVIELKRIKNSRDELLTNPYDYYTIHEENPSPPIRPADLRYHRSFRKPLPLLTWFLP